MIHGCVGFSESKSNDYCGHIFIRTNICVQQTLSLHFINWCMVLCSFASMHRAHSAYSLFWLIRIRHIMSPHDTFATSHEFAFHCSQFTLCMHARTLVWICISKAHPPANRFPLQPSGQLLLVQNIWRQISVDRWPRARPLSAHARACHNVIFHMSVCVFEFYYHTQQRPNT